MGNASAVRVEIIEKEAALLGLRVVTLMHQRGIGLRPLAKAAQIPLSTLQKICAGESPQPSVWTVKGLAQALGTTTDYLCGLIDTPPPQQPRGRRAVATG